MAQVEVRPSRKPYSRGESTDARINREIQMASLCACSVGEITAKLVSRMRLVAPHMVRATNMRMIICFMIFLSFCNPPTVNSFLILRHTKSWLSTTQRSFAIYSQPEAHILTLG